jgi:hypothetical protein
MKNYLDKLPEDVTQIAVGAAAGAAAMYLAEKLIQVPLQNNIRDWRTKFIDLKDAGKIAESEALYNKAPLGAKNISPTTVKDLSVLALGILAKAAAPKNTYTEYATDGVIFFAVADLLTRGVGQIAYNAEFGK